MMKHIILTATLPIVLFGCASITKNTTPSTKSTVPNAPQQCKTANSSIKGDNDTFKVCLTKGVFSHDNYVFYVNNQRVYAGIDDDVEKFTTTKNGVTYQGGCTPVNSTMNMGGMVVPVEVARNCSISYQQKTISGIKFTFD